MKREYRLTSKLGEMHITPHKESHKEKILRAMEKFPVGTNHEEIADAAGLRPDQVWKRLSELSDKEQKGGAKIFDTGLMKPLKSGVPGIVWTLKEFPQTTAASNLHVVFSLPDEPPTNPSLIQQRLF